jgi:hypothetical protein
MGARKRGADYAGAVVDALVGVGEFSDLTDPTTASIGPSSITPTP